MLRPAAAAASHSARPGVTQVSICAADMRLAISLHMGVPCVRVQLCADGDVRCCCGCAVLQVFAPAFRRNARWSVDSKVPDVGDESSGWEEVSAFYDFWYAFKSWREFPHPGARRHRG